MNSPLYGKRVAKFVISQLEKSTIGETPSDDFEIEHIFPKQPHRDWGIEVNEDVERLRNTWGNLIPLTVVMNPSVGNGIYALKRIEYQKAVFASPRQVASEYDLWDMDTIVHRSKKISDWAVKRWHHKR